MRELGQQIRLKRGEIEGRRSELHGLDAFRTELDQLRSERPSLSKELDAEHEAFQRRKTAFEHLQAAVEFREATLADILNAVGPGLDIEPLLAEVRDANLVVESEALLQSLRAFTKLAASIRRDVSEIKQDDHLQPVLQAISLAIEKRNSNYYKLRQEQQAVNESLKKEEALKKQVVHLERLQRDLEKLIEEERKLSDERKFAPA